MTEEEFEKIKEAEKEKLRAQKKLRKLKRALRRKQTIRSAVQRMAEGAQSVLSRSTELMEKLTSETARQQARLEVAMDVIEEDPDLETDADVNAYEAERKAARAKELIRQMKQSGPSNPERTRSSGQSSSSSNTKSGDKTSSGATDSGTTSSTPDDDLPEKTIGRMR